MWPAVVGVALCDLFIYWRLGGFRGRPAVDYTDPDNAPPAMEAGGNHQYSAAQPPCPGPGVCPEFGREHVHQYRRGAPCRFCGGGRLHAIHDVSVPGRRWLDPGLSASGSLSSASRRRVSEA